MSGDLYQLLRLDIDKPIRLSVCGAGGKTTLLQALAREANLYGKKAGLITTVRMRAPHEEDMFVFYGYGSKWMHKVWKSGRIIVAGGSAGRGWLGEADRASVDFQLRYAELLAVKADFSQGLPLKWPLADEPKLLPQSSCALVMMGLSALGRPFDEVCLNAAAARQALDFHDEIVNEDILARLIHQGYSRFTSRAFLNQADDERLRLQGEEVARMLYRLGWEQVVVDSLQQRGLCREYEDMPVQVSEHGYH